MKMDKDKKRAEKYHTVPKAFRSPLAYENPGFVHGPDGRSLRILAEYWEPLARFRKERVQDTVVFFGSARWTNLSSAQQSLQLLDKPGSATPAPPEEQPSGSLMATDGDLSRKRAQAAVEMARYYEDARKLAYMLR